MSLSKGESSLTPGAVIGHGAEHGAGASGKQQTGLRRSDSDSPQGGECAAVGSDHRPNPAQEPPAVSGRAQSSRGVISVAPSRRGRPHDVRSDRILDGQHSRTGPHRWRGRVEPDWTASSTGNGSRGSHQVRGSVECRRTRGRSPKSFGNTSAAAVPYTKKSYHSMAVPIKLAKATRRIDLRCAISSPPSLSNAHSRMLVCVCSNEQRMSAPEKLQLDNRIGSSKRSRYASGAAAGPVVTDADRRR